LSFENQDDSGGFPSGGEKNPKYPVIALVSLACASWLVYLIGLRIDCERRLVLCALIRIDCNEASQ